MTFRIVFFVLFSYAETKFNLPVNNKESYKKLFRYFRDSQLFEFRLYENSRFSDPKAFFEIVESEITSANENLQKIIFVFVGRGQTLIRNKNEKNPLFGLYGYIPGRFKNSINLLSLNAKYRDNKDLVFIIHSEKIELEPILKNSAISIIYINDKSNFNCCIVPLIMERIFRKMLDSRMAYTIDQFASDFSFDSKFFSES